MEKYKNIKSIAKKIGVNSNQLEMFGQYKAKINFDKIESNKNGKLILVTAINPTKYGEGKTTVSIGLADALRLLKQKSIVSLREPSLGPVFGLKGGATGGGKAQVVPSDDINLHFTGDFHAITSANNLISAMIYNSIYFGNPLNIDENKINFNRCLDVNDRALRNIEQNIENKFLIKDSFNITAASEIMAILSLATSLEDLKERIGNICIAFDRNDKAIYLKQLNFEDSVVALLIDAIKPNLVQTLEGTPALVHCGPFANISHGTNSVVATKTALKIADYCITEAGFGADLGGQKFLDFICPTANLNPSCVVLVATLKALKLNGGMLSEDIEKKSKPSIKKGLKLLVKHFKNLTNIYNMNVVVAINKYPSDNDDELFYLQEELNKLNIENAIVSPFLDGGKGCVDLAKLVIKAEKKQLNTSYNKTDEIEEKIDKIVKHIYGATNLIFSETAKEKLEIIRKNNLNKLDVIIAKTQYSLSDNASKIGVTSNFDFTITDLKVNSGAGYIVAMAGKTLLMPGLNKNPNALNIKLKNNKILGIN